VAGVISVGGLATGLDTNEIITKLLQLERRPVALLERELAATEATKTSIGTVSSKLSALKTAVDALKTIDDVLVRKATSSEETVLTAAAGAGAARGSTTLTVTQLARASAAGSTVGVDAATSVIAAGAGSFQFQVGAGAVQTVNVTAGTTLQGLADAINALDTDVTASAINLGTSTDPDYRLQIVSKTSGSANTIAVVRDDTSIAIQASQAGLDAQFTVTGFSGTFSRSSNTFSDVIQGVTVSLVDEGTATVTVEDDQDAIVEQIQAVVTAFNDAVTFVAGESTVEANEDEETVDLGSLAADATVRRLSDRLHDTVSKVFEGAAGRYVNLSSLGISTEQDGTLALDETKLRAALADDVEAVAEVFAGNATTTAGIADDLSTLIENAVATGGSLSTRTSALDEQIDVLQDQIDDGERRLAAVEVDLRRQFAALEELVGTLQSQSSFLLQALGA
jgi:flagellar hook-associated protein 2